MIFDFENGDFLFKTSDDTAMDFDSGEFHFTSEWDRSEVDDEE